MHTLMNFAGAVGVLMSDTGLETILQAAFGGVSTILTFEHHVISLKNSCVKSFSRCSRLMAGTQDKNQSHSKLWVENLIQSVMTMMMFNRAEREADRPLHLWSVKEMVP